MFQAVVYLIFTHQEPQRHRPKLSVMDTVEVLHLTILPLLAPNSSAVREPKKTLRVSTSKEYDRPEGN